MNQKNDMSERVTLFHFPVSYKNKKKHTHERRVIQVHDLKKLSSNSRNTVSFYSINYKMNYSGFDL